jgi:adenosylcobinamide-phosphate synthase
MPPVDPPWPSPFLALPAGALLDALLGDPRGWPHPVRAVGWLIARAERALRAILPGPPAAERAAGVALVAVVVGVTAASAWGVVAACDHLGGPLPWLGRTILAWWGLAARGLRDEALRASEAPDLDAARSRLAGVVGRDTHALDWPEVRRACVETLGENASDGVVAPLLWYAVGGPAGMWAYKAVNTLDSMVGYRSDRYRRFGWAAARLDDLANLAPARLTWLLMGLAAPSVGLDAPGALRIGWRDARKHPSPNSGWGEAATAGALGVQLGGPSTYGGVPGEKPRLGDPGPPLDAAHVRGAARLMLAASALALALAWTFRALVLRLP